MWKGKGDISRKKMQVFHNHPCLVAYIIFYNDSCSFMAIHQVCEERQELMRNSPVSTTVYTTKQLAVAQEFVKR